MGNSSSRTIQFPNKISEVHQPPHRFLFKFSNNVLNVPPICEEFHSVKDQWTFGNCSKAHQNNQPCWDSALPEGPQAALGAAVPQHFLGEQHRQHISLPNRNPIWGQSLCHLNRAGTLVSCAELSPPTIFVQGITSALCHSFSIHLYWAFLPLSIVIIHVYSYPVDKWLGKNWKTSLIQ